MAETILSLEDAGLSLMGNAGPVDILNGVSLTISKGESVSLVG
ncbi:MAG: ABC transporter, partial [Rhodobacteraceae bacterium]|nr:ABC transporter [Paracoccaceae bacterium]